MDNQENVKRVRDAKRLFRHKGTCSNTMFFILNREFGQPLPQEEQASDWLAGGIVKQGYQCGMLWGAVLATGAEASRRGSDPGQARAVAMAASRQVLDSFVARARSPDCLGITSCDWTSKLSMAKYMLTGKFLSCFRLVDRWAGEAIAAARMGLDEAQKAVLPPRRSCASELVRLMGGSEAEQVMVAGFAGGLACMGGGCGALAAALWYNSLLRVRAGTYKMTMSDAELERVHREFLDISGFEMECREICKRRFSSDAEHDEFVAGGGCSALLALLARLARPKAC